MPIILAALGVLLLLAWQNQERTTSASNVHADAPSIQIRWEEAGGDEHE